MGRWLTFVFWQMMIILIVFTVSNAGYFTSDAFNDFMTKGYVTEKAAAQMSDAPDNPLLFIGTATSVLSFLVLLFNIPRRMPLLVGLILPMQLWILLSSLWSNTIMPTTVLFVKCILYANALNVAIERLDERRLHQAILAAIGIILTASLLLCLTNPVFQISIGAEGWRGLFAQKNRLASFCLFSALMIFPILRHNLILGTSVLALDVVMLVLSKGKTEIALLALSLVFIVLFNLIVRGHRNLKSGLLTISFSFATIFTIVWIFTIYFVYTGSIDFTGRATLWRWYLQDLGENFMIGQGGMTASADPVFVERAMKSGFPPTSDSSYIMMIYNNGIIGLLMFFYSVSRVCSLAINGNSKRYIYLLIASFCYVCFAAMESDTRFSLYFTTFSLFILYGVLAKTVATEADENSPAIRDGQAA